VEALIPCSILGAAGWWWLVRRTSRTGGWRAPAGEWRIGDDIFAGTIGLYFLLTILGGSSAERTLKPEEIHATVAFCGVAILLIVVMVSSRGRSLTAAFGLTAGRPLGVALTAVACLAFTYPLVELAVWIATELGGAASENDDMVQYFRSELGSTDLAWAIVMAVVAAPLFEELVFRGYLYGVIKRHVGSLWSGLTTALFFAAVHQNLPAFPAYFLLGLALVLAYEIAGSLWAPIAMHMIFNSITVVIILWFPQWIH
jgi:membrane protease YdiL (CAAX protease family)